MGYYYYYYYYYYNYNYDDRDRLVCDKRGQSGTGARKRTCPYRVLGDSLNGLVSRCRTATRRRCVTGATRGWAAGTACTVNVAGQQRRPARPPPTPSRRP
jgi:hypothetical protein